MQPISFPRSTPCSLCLSTAYFKVLDIIRSALSRTFYPAQLWLVCLPSKDSLWNADPIGSWILKSSARNCTLPFSDLDKYMHRSLGWLECTLSSSCPKHERISSQLFFSGIQRSRFSSYSVSQSTGREGLCQKISMYESCIKIRAVSLLIVLTRGMLELYSKVKF